MLRMLRPTFVLRVLALGALIFCAPMIFAADETPAVHADALEDAPSDSIPSLGLAPSLNALLTAQTSVTCEPTAGFEDNCSDGLDNDCDGCVDYNDIDCGVIGCIVCNGVGAACCAKGQPCQLGTECCSGSCKGKPGAKTCR